MTPKEIHQRAVDAAREWRDEERSNHHARTMPKPGTVVLITREGAPDQYMQVAGGRDCQPPAQPGWAYLHGCLIDEQGFDTPDWLPYWPVTLYLRHVEGDHWEMVPYYPLPEPGPELAARNAEILKKRLGR
jgi:hypothetical protein